MIQPNPLAGIGLHAAGGISASACYLPYEKTKNWSWGTFWIVQAAFAWLIVPFILGITTVPEFFTVLKESPSPAVLGAFLLGAAYGFGGLSFGYAIRHIGFSLTYTISIGISAILGTVTPLLLKGQLIESFLKPGGLFVLMGIILSLSGIALCAVAGYKKEKGIASTKTGGDRPVFNMNKGLKLTIFAGILSAVFGISLEVGQPIADVAAKYGAGHFEGNAKTIVSTAGCLITNLAWFIIQGLRDGTIKELKTVRSFGTLKYTRNFVLSAFAGSLWYMQFFFYGLGHVRMGKFMFASWVIHMCMLVFFSYSVGLIMKEWKGVKKPALYVLFVALFILVVSFIVITYGSMKGEGVI